ncbi:MAG: hypothetical protein K8F91_12745 [Candidatus Obscuribacterales bacterium]|nr:hypothetical protein [Candidatus Obscuribacterales bacterium]
MTFIICAFITSSGALAQDSRLPETPPVIENLLKRVKTLPNGKPRVGIIFRQWANKRKPFAASFLFCTLFSIVGLGFFPRSISLAKDQCRSGFWKSLGLAVLVSITCLTLANVLMLIEIGQPLAQLLLAILELMILTGLCVAVSMVGEGLLKKTGIIESSWARAHPRLLTLAIIIVGSLVVAAILQIPGFGNLPRIGIRIAVLLALAGAGGLLKTIFARAQI